MIKYKYFWLVALLLSGILGGVASICLRLAALKDSENIIPLALRGVAICMYGTGFIVYMLSLKRINLSTAYPTMVSTSVLMVIAFTYLYEGTLRTAQAIGAILLICSIWLVN